MNKKLTFHVTPTEYVEALKQRIDQLEQQIAELRSQVAMLNTMHGGEGE